MKKLFFAIFLTVSLTGAHVLGAASESPDFSAVLKKTPVAQWPAQLVALTGAADAQTQPEVLRRALAAVGQLRPAALPSASASLAKAYPAAAPEIAVAAVDPSTKEREINQIIRAVVASTPQSTSNIVYALVRAFPVKYQQVALVAVKTAPDQAAAILQSLAAARPDLSQQLQPTQPDARPVTASDVVAILRQVKSGPIQASGENLQGPPTIQPPYIPLTSTPSQSPIGDATIVPPGGRDYAQP